MTTPLSSHGALLMMGDGVGTSGALAFTGTGSDDLTFDGANVYRGGPARTLRVEIDYAGANDTFRWSLDGGTKWEAEGIPIPGAAAAYELDFGIVIEFAAITGHVLNDYWDSALAGVFTAIAETVDSTGVSVEQAIHDAMSQDRAWTKKVAGVSNAKDFSLDINLIPKDPTHDESTGLTSLTGNTFSTGFKLVYPDAGVGTASEWFFDAYVALFDRSNAVDGILSGTVTFAVDGEPVPIAGT